MLLHSIPELYFIPVLLEMQQNHHVTVAVLALRLYTENITIIKQHDHNSNAATTTLLRSIQRRFCCR